MLNYFLKCQLSTQERKKNAIAPPLITQIKHFLKVCRIIVFQEKKEN